jgi:hypothetical protein
MQRHDVIFSGSGERGIVTIARQLALAIGGMSNYADDRPTESRLNFAAPQFA